MNKTIFIPSFFQSVHQDVYLNDNTEDVKQLQDLMQEVTQTGLSDCQIDGERLGEDVARAILELNCAGYEIICITAITSGSWKFKYDTGAVISGSGRGGYGYGYGFSYTEGVLLTAKLSEGNHK